MPELVVPLVRVVVTEGPDSLTIVRRTYLRDGEILEERRVTPKHSLRERLGAQVQRWRARRAAWLDGTEAEL